MREAVLDATSLYTNIFIYIILYMCACVNIYIHIYIHTYMHTYIHTYIHTDTYICKVKTFEYMGEAIKDMHVRGAGLIGAAAGS